MRIRRFLRVRPFLLKNEITMKLIHLTDTHLVTPGETIYGLDPLFRLNSAIDSINEFHSDADLCVITGDLAHTAQPKAYMALKGVLNRLTIPCRFIMGNHDDRQLLLDHFSDLSLDDYGFLQTACKTSAGIFLLLDTVKTGTHQGAYCSKRQTWLKEQLNLYKDEPVYLFAHHPPFDVGIPAMDAISIDKKNAKDLAEICKHYSNIQHLFFGHLHRPLSGNWMGISFSTLRSTNHQVWLDFNATEQIPGSQEPPAYAIALIEEDQLVVHTHDFMDSSPKYNLGSWNWDAWHSDNA